MSKCPNAPRVRVALDTNPLFTTRAGTARYLRGLLKGFKRSNPADLFLLEVCWPVENFAFAQPTRAFKTAFRESIWSKMLAPAIIRNNQADLLHSVAPALISPPHGCKQVSTLCDVALLAQPDRFRRWHRWSGARRLQQLHQANAVICISQFTADECMKYLHLPSRKLVVIHCGCDFHPEEPSPTEQPPMHLPPREFFLFVGSLEPGKNLSLLQKVYGSAQSRGLTLPDLVIVGARWSGVSHEMAPPANWHYLGHQPDAVLVYLYRRAVALVFPSKYEGFGLPVAEAMALGCPVICSRVASLPEVGGEAVIYSSLDPDSYLKAMISLCQDEQLRNSLTAQGLEQARRFSWRKCADETARVYRQALQP